MILRDLDVSAVAGLSHGGLFHFADARFFRNPEFYLSKCEYMVLEHCVCVE